MEVSGPWRRVRYCQGERARGSRPLGGNAVAQFGVAAVHQHDVLVILQVEPDPWQRVAGNDPVARKLLGRADAGQQQQLRRVDRPGAQDHFPACQQLPDPAVLADFHTAGTSALQQHPVGQGAAQYRQVLPVQDRVQEGPCRAAALAVDLGDMEGPEAFLLRAIEVRIVAPAQLGGGLVEHLIDRARAALLGDVELAVLAVPRRGAGFEMLRALEVGQQFVMAPAWLPAAAQRSKSRRWPRI